jgi:hypothetical protein
MKYALGNMLSNSGVITAGTNLLSGLIAYWKLEEASGTRYDSHGSYDLTENVGIDNGVGVKGDCAVSNSTYDDGRSLTISPSPYDSVGSSWSLSFWIAANGGDAPQMFPNAWGNCCIFTIPTIDGSQILRGQIWKDEQAGGDDGTDISKSGIYTGGFVHVAITHHFTTKTVRVYYNGAEEHLVAYSTSLNSVVGGDGSSGGENSLLSMFAGDLDGVNYAGPGKLDEVGIWGRAITADEVSALYNGGSGITYEEL